MTIQELMEKRAKVWEAAKNFVDTHENENGVLSGRTVQPMREWKRRLRI